MRISDCSSDVCSSDLSPSQRRILEAARREGLKSGFTVPANIPGEAHGSCSFACAKDRAFPTEYLLAAQLIGTFAFNAARQICCRRCPTRCRAVHLTDRQRPAEHTSELHSLMPF